MTQGSDDVVVAVVDTGVRFDHPDLKRVSAGGRLLDGYDFISELGIAGDGDGRDTNASDPGDWCDGEASSWHGTRVAGIVGALTDNAIGVAGTTWRGRILPVRGLGKCGGTDSDLIAGMLWAAGIPVAGVPANPNPAKVINLSLGSSGACPASWRDAISQVVARGALVVVSAGNEGGPVGAPANCPGVAGVGAIRHAGTKVGFSNLGREVAISAPGGNCVNTSGACLFSIDTTSNAGTTSPGAHTYTDQNDVNVGTSFSAPIVAGVAALMVAVNERLSPAELIRRLQSGSKPFPRSASVADCHVPTGPGDVQIGECNCTTATCGAGMVNARGAVLEALRPAAVASANPTNATTGQVVNLDGSSSFAANGRSIVAYAWTVASSSGPAPTIANADSPNASFTATSDGAVTLRLAVTDDQGARDSVDVGVNGPGPGITVTVSPGSATVRVGTAQAFSAAVSNTADTQVTWQVDGVAGGNATVGTITSAGVYTAPATVPSPATVTVRAVSKADSARFGSAAVTITAAPTGGGGDGGGGGGGGGGAVDAAWLLAGLLMLALRAPAFSRKAA
jgi:serine protease